MPWKYYMPNGDYYLLDDSISQEQADDIAHKRFPEQFPIPESTISGSFMHGLKSLGSEVQELAEIPFKGADVAAERAARRERELAERYGTGASFEGLSKTYEDEGLFSAAGELAKQSAMAIAEGAPTMVGMGGAAMLGGVPGLVASAYLPRVASGLEEQAATQMEKGKPVDVSLGKAAAFAAPQAALDIAAQAIPLGKTAAGKIFGPEVEKLLARGELTQAEKAAQDAVAADRSMLTSIGRGVGKNLVAQELIQPTQIALSRLENDQDLLSDDALAQYGNAMYMAGIMSPLGAIEGISERGAAKGRVEERARIAEEKARRAAEEAPGIDEESGQMTFAPELFGEEGKETGYPKFEPIKTHMEKTLGRELTDDESEILRSKLEETTSAPTPELDADALESTYQTLKQQYQEELVRRGDERTLTERPAVSPDQEDFFRAEVQPIAGEQIRPAREIQLTADEEAGLRADAQTKVTELAEAKPTTTPYSGQLELPGMETPRAGLFGEELYQARFDKEAEAAQREAGEALRATRGEEAAPETEGRIQESAGNGVEEEPPVSRAAEAMGIGQDKYQGLVNQIHLTVDPEKQWVTPNFVAKALDIELPQAKDVMKDLETDGYIDRPNKAGWYKPTTKVAEDAAPIPRARMMGASALAEEPPLPRARMLGGRNVATPEPGRARMMGAANIAEEAPTPMPRMIGGRNIAMEEQRRAPMMGGRNIAASEPGRARMIGGRNLSLEEPENVSPISSDIGRNAGSIPGERPIGRGISTGTEQRVPQTGTEPSGIKKPKSSGLATSTTPTPGTNERTTPLNDTVAPSSEPVKSTVPRKFLSGEHAADVLQGQFDLVSKNLPVNPLNALLKETVKKTVKDARTGAYSTEKVNSLLDRIASIKATQEKKGQVPRLQLGKTEGKGVGADVAHGVIQDVTSKWKNAPKFNVAETVADLPEHLQHVEPTAKGIYDPTTQTVHIISRNADAINPHASIKATVFHESLGHFGLERAFGNSLDATLKNLYRTNNTVRERTHAWLERNPEAYKDSSERIPRVVEETLADMSERGELEKAPTGLHLAFNKIADLVRGFLERMGLKQKDYGRAEMREIVSTLRRAHEAVTKSTTETPIRTDKPISPEIRYQRQSEGVIQDDIPEDTGTAKAAASARKIQEARATGNPKEELERYGDADLHFPRVDEGIKAATMEALSKAGDKLKDAAIAFMSMNHKAQIYGDKLPSLWTMDKTINSRGAELKMRREALNAKMKGWLNTIADKKYSKALLNNFYDIATRSTLDQIELLNDPKRKRTREESALAKRFDSLPKELQGMYKDMRDTYEDIMHGYVDLIAGTMPASEAAKYRADFEAGRLKVYLPLFRKGSYWVSYTDKEGNPVKTSFTSKYRRDVEAARVKASGIKDVETYLNLRQLRETGAPPTGFLGSILKTLKEQGVTDPEVLDSIYETYMDYVPAGSLRQRFRPRERYLGMEPDVLNAFANTADKMTSLMNNLKYAPKIDEAMAKLKEEALTGDNRSNETLTRIVADTEKQMDFIRNPKINKWAARAGYGSYMWYLAGNASSAIVNLSHLPMMVYPMLGGRYGYFSAHGAFKKAMSAVKIQLKDEAPKGYEDLYRVATEAGALGLHVEQELFDMKKTSAADYTGMKAKVQTGMDYMFRITEKMNRETALIAAYELALKKNKGNVEVAQKDAIQLVKEAYGSALTEAGPRVMQNNAAKVMLTFKGFNMNRMFVVGKLFREAFKGENETVRSMAKKQLIGIHAMAFAFGGVIGMPMVGALEFLANQLTGDEDEPTDAATTVRTAVGDLAYYGPFGHLLNIAVSDRLGFNNLFIREDPRRMADVGLVDFMMEQSMGPMYNVVSQTGEAYDYFKQGNYQRMFESMTPTAIRNVAKAVRYGMHGAKTVTGKPLGDVSAYNVLMQAAGFAPEDIAEKRAIASSITEEERKINARYRALISRANGAYRRGDLDDIQEVNEDINKFVTAHPGKNISMKTIQNSIKTSILREEQSVFGINPDKKLAGELLANQGYDLLGEPLED